MQPEKKEWCIANIAIWVYAETEQKAKEHVRRKLERIFQREDFDLDLSAVTEWDRTK